MSMADELTKLQSLRETGVLSEEEFALAKTRIITQAEPASTSTQSSVSKFIHSMGRSNKDVMLGGVCGGLAEQTGTPPWLWRLGFASTAFFFGTGFLAYGLLWLLLPYQNEITQSHSAT
ncbi:hypothetical protein GCM10009007_16250 [Formosimonas limnophila]|uniref:Phage shock protein PspC N-terminal domain-containing protein n=1 Tax=Formosimonas limnophila TaxID=1384487 RepID=A0A8J3CLE5_9BURK|nr:PspC domain-containing protein [Formosimonas limnophila]GHA75959.1 hypothetical protein GCM10009007_16250 [Formosimonas limnophila]